MQPQNTTLQPEMMAVTSCEISNNLAVDFKASPATTPAVYAIRPDATRQVRIAYEYVEEPQRFQALALLSPDVPEQHNIMHLERMKERGCTPTGYYQNNDHKTHFKEVMWQLSEHRYGRLQPIGYIALATMQRRSRNTIINYYCDDFDIVAAIFSVTLNKAEAAGSTCNDLKTFCQDREEIFKQDQKEYRKTRDEIQEVWNSRECTYQRW